MRTTALLLALGLLLPVAATAQQMTATGDYLLHYNALPSSQLPEEIAQRYGLIRSPQTVVLTVSVQKRGQPGAPQPVAADVEVTATDAQGRTQPLRMREVVAGNDVSYLGQARIGDGDGETLTFGIQARPRDGDPDAGQPPAPLRATYRQAFFR
ncbi:DUF4426 domain-containing protein [Coralloluteibacterium stylophorae]|uniref:DUF4426 domain-containing protein n=1 Tax=Coralloluteibacterium stylophorae TaxID=1776034 RepID=A0A8J7VS62_9GAMM|nr:DUF4426 domain-containing protein [Coralloluteibacterium stylophorae]MBS7456412.1 DUF4426 domain-containing protein [Coralloluteibacterium stylophorae]